MAAPRTDPPGVPAEEADISGSAGTGLLQSKSTVVPVKGAAFSRNAGSSVTLPTPRVMAAM